MAKRPFRKPNSTLTARQDAFAREYLADLNASAAARRAGFSAKTAGRQAIDLLTKPHVLARIQQPQAARNARVQVDADYVLARLFAEVEADAADLYDAEGKLKPVHEWPPIWRKGLVSGIRTTTLYERDASGKNVEIGFMKDVQFADRAKRIELLGRHIHIQAFKERVSMGVDDPLKRLFEQISGQSVRPSVERTIEHDPNSASAPPSTPSQPPLTPYSRGSS